MALPNKSETDLALRPRHDEGRREEVALLPAAIGSDGHHEVPAHTHAMKSNFNPRFVGRVFYFTDLSPPRRDLIHCEQHSPPPREEEEVEGTSLNLGRRVARRGIPSVAL